MQKGSEIAEKKSMTLWLVLGFLLGAALPICFGLRAMFQFNQYVTSLPPNTPVCGNPQLGALVMIIVVGPIGGLIGAASGWVANEVWQ